MISLGSFGPTNRGVVILDEHNQFGCAIPPCNDILSHVCVLIALVCKSERLGFKVCPRACPLRSHPTRKGREQDNQGLGSRI
jgi:hypothetical protein